jgi:hypothetical protein
MRIAKASPDDEAPPRIVLDPDVPPGDFIGLLAALLAAEDAVAPPPASEEDPQKK